MNCLSTVASSTATEGISRLCGPRAPGSRRELLNGALMSDAEAQGKRPGSAARTSSRRRTRGSTLE
jgi:hypothetical protein